MAQKENNIKIFNLIIEERKDKVMTNIFLYFEQVVNAIHKVVFNEMMSYWRDGTDRAIIFYMYNEQASIVKVAEDLGYDEDFIKKRINRIVSYYDSQYEFQNHESFSRRGR